MDAVFLLEHGLRMYSVATSWLLSEGLLTILLTRYRQKDRQPKMTETISLASHVKETKLRG